MWFAGERKSLREFMHVEDLDQLFCSENWSPDSDNAQRVVMEKINILNVGVAKIYQYLIWQKKLRLYNLRVKWFGTKASQMGLQKTIKY